jgi:hypothetical protein
MILQIKKIKNKNGMVEYTLEDSGPMSGFLNRGKSFGFAVSAIPNHFYKQVEDCLKEQEIVIPAFLYEFSVKRTKTGFVYVITF